MIGQLASAIGYPEQVPDQATVYAFRVDGEEYRAEVIGNRLVMKRVLAIAETDLPRFAEYAAGRLLREEAVFAWDDRAEQAIVWQELPMQEPRSVIVSAFEDFIESCEWWLQRVNELQTPPTVFPDILIRP